jgi:hypothetical protein
MITPYNNGKGNYEDNVYLIDSLRKYVYDNREWTTGTWSKEANQQLKSTQENLKYYFKQYDLRVKVRKKRWNKFLKEMEKKYPD